MLKNYCYYCKKNDGARVLEVEYLDGGYVMSGKREYVLNLSRQKCPDQRTCQYASECEFLKKIPSSI